MWDQLSSTVSKLLTKTVHDAKKPFSIVQINTWCNSGKLFGIQASQTSHTTWKIAYQQSKSPLLEVSKARFNQSVARDAKLLTYRFNNEGKFPSLMKYLLKKGVSAKRRQKVNIFLKKS